MGILDLIIGVDNSGSTGWTNFYWQNVYKNLSPFIKSRSLCYLWNDTAKKVELNQILTNKTSDGGTNLLSFLRNVVVECDTLIIVTDGAYTSNYDKNKNIIIENEVKRISDLVKNKVMLYYINENPKDIDNLLTNLWIKYKKNFEIYENIQVENFNILNSQVYNPNITESELLEVLKSVNKENEMTILNSIRNVDKKILRKCKIKIIESTIKKNIDWDYVFNSKNDEFIELTILSFLEKNVVDEYVRLQISIIDRVLNYNGKDFKNIEDYKNKFLTSNKFDEKIYQDNEETNDDNFDAITAELLNTQQFMFIQTDSQGKRFIDRSKRFNSETFRKLVKNPFTNEDIKLGKILTINASNASPEVKKSTIRLNMKFMSITLGREVDYLPILLTKFGDVICQLTKQEFFDLLPEEINIHMSKGGEAEMIPKKYFFKALKIFLFKDNSYSYSNIAWFFNMDKSAQDFIMDNFILNDNPDDISESDKINFTRKKIIVETINNYSSLNLIDRQTRLKKIFELKIFEEKLLSFLCRELKIDPLIIIRNPFKRYMIKDDSYVYPNLCLNTGFSVIRYQDNSGKFHLDKPWDHVFNVYKVVHTNTTEDIFKSKFFKIFRLVKNGLMNIYNKNGNSLKYNSIESLIHDVSLNIIENMFTFGLTYKILIYTDQTDYIYISEEVEKIVNNIDTFFKGNDKIDSINNIIKVWLKGNRRYLCNIPECSCVKYLKV